MTVLANPSVRSLSGGRPIRVAGVVEEGDHRGRTLGFPTANVAIDPDIRIEEGVYVGIVLREDGTAHASAVSVGRRETFYEGEAAPCLVEAYLLDFEGDLYGEILLVHLLRMLRRQQRFESVEDLLLCIKSDVAAVREHLRDGRLGCYLHHLTTT